MFKFGSVPVRLIAGVVCFSFLVGCSSSPVNKGVLKNMLDSDLCSSLESYRVVTILPFDVQAGVKAPDQCGKIFAHYIYLSLSYKYSHLFDQIKDEKPLGVDDEVIISGQILKYQAGSKFARFETYGAAGGIKFEANLVLSNGKTKDIICQVPIRESWGWWDSFKSIDGLMRKDAEAIAQTIVRLKNQKL